MAQASALTPNGTPSTMATNELREILEYEKIVQFRDAIFAGSHPRIKIPHLAGKQIESPRSPSTPSLSAPLPNTTSQYTRPASCNSLQAPLPYPNGRTPNIYRVGTGKSEINPILLEKSDDLIRAEIQLQRQRLERSLREQMEQQKLAAKSQLQSSESLPNFDLTEVLSKALARVPPVIVATAEASVDARSSASDSFDENTFYSSQHDTPEPFSSPNGPKEPGEVQSIDVMSIDVRPAEALSTESHEHQDVLSNNNHLASHLELQAQQLPSQLPIQTQSIDPQQSLEMSNSESSSSRGAHIGGTSDVSSQQKDGTGVSTQQILRPRPTAMAVEHPAGRFDGQVSTEHLLQQAFADNTTSPLIRAHNLSPIAPQPARVSPLATARAPPIVQEARFPDEAQPPQVAALRQQPAGISSTDSSPKGEKSSDKKKVKKEKKKKRKASINDKASPDSPYIKPEPRSPSPFSVMPLPRPQKRQRQVGQFAAELNYDEPNGEEQERITERYEPAPLPRTRERFEDHYDQRPRRVEPSYQRIERDHGDYRVSSGSYVRRPITPTAYALPYGPGQGDQVRAATHLTERRVYEEPIYYREPVPRYSVRPDANRDRSSRSPVMHERRSPIPMAPPRAQVRIVVDEYGREYIDRSPPPMLRQSVAPATRYRDSEIIYECAPIRTASARGPVEAYEEGGIVYRRPSPPMLAPRRVITQPEYAMPEYRPYRQREYSARPGPMAPPGEEIIQARGPVERRQMSHFEEVPREYARAPTVRPEPVRYDIPREYVGRLQSVRPEPPPRNYAASDRPEARREIPIQSQREYSVRPIETMPRREHVAGAEPERYYDEVPRARPAEVAFIERPRAREASVVVYADDVRREVYR